MDLNTRQILESEGLQVVEVLWDAKYKTKTFIRHPDGRLNPYYDTLNQIPQLPYGTQLDLNKNAMPYDNIYGQPTAQVNAGAIIDSSGQMDGLPLPVIGWIVIAIVMVAIVICTYFFTHPGQPEPRCNPEIIDVSECLKIIILPNCDSRSYNACTDEWAEDEWHEYPEEQWGWIQWAVIGIAVIGVIIIVPPLIRSFQKPPP